MMDEVVSWAGEPVAEMTRERLLEVFQQLARKHRAAQQETLRQFTVLRAHNARMVGGETGTPTLVTQDDV